MLIEWEFQCSALRKHNAEQAAAAVFISPPQPEAPDTFEVPMDTPRPRTPPNSILKDQSKMEGANNSEPAQLRTPESPLYKDIGTSPAAPGRPTSSDAAGLRDPPLFGLDTAASATDRPLFSSWDGSAWIRSASTPKEPIQSTTVVDAAPTPKEPSPKAVRAQPKRPNLYKKRAFLDMLTAEVDTAIPTGRKFALKNVPASKRPRMESDPEPCNVAYSTPNVVPPLKPHRFKNVSTATRPELIDLSRPLRSVGPSVRPSVRPLAPMRGNLVVAPVSSSRPTSSSSQSAVNVASSRRAPSPAPPAPRRRQSAPKPSSAEKEDTSPHWSTIPDFTPPLSTLDDPTVVLEPLNWRGKTRKSFAHHEAVPYLHPKELVLCEKLAFCPFKYLRSKRQIFERFVAWHQENGSRKVFNKTAAQGATNIDVTIASALHEAFLKAGWFDPRWFAKYFDA
ncbi:uncharacterized protein EI97DRAFT_122741 [Westerdykella ornata]|uniref:SWIRM domain-containing protein n=1 Tax=Westerdykella ornata TaxID=318751 RepID=A0A6A6JVK5_WESOR|nr:uncharacterized protein EI97DRAFT_122741 [Westerdykella ornata]KAF2280417.1 hypothetical protein EI97DRAFT_122741 [Westerdykella ornata]